MLVLKFSINVQFVIFDIKSLRRNFPTFSSITEQVLMEITNTVGIAFVYLSKAFILNHLLNCFPIDFRIKSQFYRIDNILIKLMQCNFPPIRFDS